MKSRSGLGVGRVGLVGLLVAASACESPGADVTDDQAVVQSAIVTANNTITQAADEGRTGWFPDQPGLDPSIVGGGSFKRLFQTTLPLKDPAGNNDFVYAQPLVSGSTVFIATASNNIYSLDAVSGAVLAQRHLGTPFDPSVLQCGDQKYVGVTGTPVIDAGTNTAYFFSKIVTTDNTNPSWYFRGVDVGTLADKFPPALVSGHASNDASVAFFPELEHQRPGLLLMNGVVYGAFGAHCDKNLDTVKYRGWIVGFTTAGAQTTMFTTEDSTGTQAGIWNSGGGLVSDGAGRIFFVTGNGSAAKAPTAGTAPPTTLGESLVRVDLQADKSLKATQFFEPYNLIGDQDFASGGPVSLPSQFGTTATPHLMVAAGKLQVMYVIDRDHLGGYEQSSVIDTSYSPARHEDVVVSSTPLEGNGSWSKPAVWPGDGGWVYQIGSGAPLMALKYGLSTQNVPTLSIVGHTPETYGFSAGAPIVTSSGTTAGSAVLWISQTGGGGQTGTLRAYKAVPVNGTLTQLYSDAYGLQVKFTNPGVGAGRIYMGGQGTVTGYGAPSSGPVSAPATDLGAVVVGSTAKANVVITANQALTVTGVTSPDAAFTIGAATPAFPATLAKGATVSVPVTFKPTVAQAYSVNLSVATSAGTGSAAVRGTGQASTAQLTASPTSIAFGTIPFGTTTTANVVLQSSGSQAVTFTGFTAPASPFSVSGLPAVGSTLAPGASVTVVVTYAPTAAGTNTGTFGVQTNGGNSSITLSGAGGQPPKLSISSLALVYGDIATGTAETLTFTVSNTGGSDLVIDKSKPPAEGVFVAKAPALPEATVLAAGTSVVETVVFTPPLTGTYSDAWVINTNDAAAGLLTVQLTGSANQTTPLARAGWIASATVSSATDVPARALDGSTGTRFSTGKAQASGQTFELDLQTPQTFTQLALNAGNTTDFPVGYQVFTSSDGSVWGGAIATGGGSGQLTVVPFAQQTARYVKVQLTATGTKWWSIAEINVAAGGSSQPPPAPPAPPTGLTATAGAAGAIALGWSASTTAGVTYSVYRGTASGFSPSSTNIIASGLPSLTYTDTGLPASTTFFYLAEAVNSGGASVPSNQASAMTIAGASSTIEINCGGPAAAPYVADQSFTGGATLLHANPIDVSAVTSPAPAAVYQSGRLGTFSYTIPGFTAGSTHAVRLHFAETYFGAAGSRTFNVTINGGAALTNFDIFQTAGAKNKANVQSFSIPASSAGAYVIQVTTVVNNGLLSGIEIQ